MKSDLRKIFTVALFTLFAASTFALPLRFDQPFMEAARKDLKQAQNSLRNATANKGGHRERALDLTQRAINAVNAGISYDRNHRNSTDVDLDMISSDQPNMVKAREELQSAVANLRKASADKGGYRNQAIELANDAIAAVNAGIEYDRRH
ncbi:hypothetical protein BH10ACI3_BH10ACI3_16570 [soil metagenome]